MGERQQSGLFSGMEDAVTQAAKGRPIPSGRPSGRPFDASRQGSSGFPVGDPDGRPLGRTDQMRTTDSGRPTPDDRGDPPPHEMRPYQLAALAGIDALQQSGKRSALLVLATGLGKTVIAAEYIRRQVEAGNRLLFVAHREELIDQTARTLRRAGVACDVEQGPRRASMAARVVVASLQSLQGARLARFGEAHFGVVIIDEAHHAPAASYRRIIARFARAFLLGLTATPARLDGKPLGAMFGDVAYRYELREAIRDRWLAPMIARRVVVEGLDLRTVGKLAGDFNLGELNAIMGAERILHRVCAPLVELAGDRPTMLFAVSVQHAHQLADVLTKRYHRSAVALDGATAKDERRDQLDRFNRGEFQYLINYGLFTEGFDSPRIRCVAIARPTMSWALYVQMLGRGARLLGLTLEESIAAGKLDFLLLDFAGNTGKHRVIGPADALAGTQAQLEPEVRAEIDDLLAGGERNVSDVLAEVQASMHERAGRVEVLAVAAYRASQVDPFLGEQLTSPVVAAGGPITEAMRKALLDQLGMRKPPDSLTMAEAESWIAAAQKRRRAGLASFKQCSALRRASIDEVALRKMTAARANELITKLAMAAWNPAALAREPERKGAIR